MLFDKCLIRDHFLIDSCHLHSVYVAIRVLFHRNISQFVPETLKRDFPHSSRKHVQRTLLHACVFFFFRYDTIIK